MLMRMHRHAEARAILQEIQHRGGPSNSMLCNLANPTARVRQQPARPGQHEPVTVHAGETSRHLVGHGGPAGGDSRNILKRLDEHAVERACVPGRGWHQRREIRGRADQQRQRIRPAKQAFRLLRLPRPKLPCLPRKEPLLL